MSVPTVTLTGTAREGVTPHLAAADLPARVRLGRRRLAARPQALRLDAYLDAARGAAAPPPSVDYAAKAAASLGRVYLNDQYGDCVIAGKYHTVGLWSGNDRGEAVLGTDQEVYQSYQQVCGPGDNGCNIVEVLNFMRDRGLPFGGVAHRIDGYAAVDWRRKDLVQAAIYLFGSLTLGVNLPEAWTQAAVWDVTSSRVVGGHDICTCGYTPQGVQVCSWGRVYTITWPAFTSTRWLEECYVLLGPDWTGDDRLAPSGVNVDALVADLQKISGGQIPDIDPGPVPPAPPEPPPGPGPVPAKLFSLTFSRAVPRGGMVGAFRSPVAIPVGKYDVISAPAANESPDLTYPVEVSES
jgi:hypothetical protein